MTTRYEVVHRTTYTYAGAVDACYERCCLTPRDAPGQRVLDSAIDVSPTALIVSTHADFFGNPSTYVEVGEDHSRLEVVARSTVEVDRVRPTASSLSVASLAEVARRSADGDDGLEVALRTAYLLPTALTGTGATVRAFAESVLHPDQGFGASVMDLTHAIYSQLRYAPGTTSVRTTLPQLLRQRSGVCQDFAHLAVACFRSMGVPARYVSGYLETFPPPGQPKLVGSDATHAWASVLGPDGWVDLDPTNDQLVGSTYVVTAWGRDFRDVSPLRGIVLAETPVRSTLSVGVDVTSVPIPSELAAGVSSAT